MPRPSRYVHGTTSREQSRLTRLNQLMNDASLRELAVARGARVVDFGSGLGQLSRGIARGAGPRGRVLGIEFSTEQIAEAERQARGTRERTRVEFRQGDVMDPPLHADEWGRFDLAHARFVLEHVPDPLAVVKHMVRAVRPGGRIVLEDDDHDVFRIWPEPAGLYDVWRAYVRMYDRNGNDPFIGRRMVELLYAAGARPVRNTWIFFGACSGDPVFPALVANLSAILDGARATLCEQHLVDAVSFDDTMRALRAWVKRPDAAIWFSICWAEGVRPSRTRGTR